MSNSLSIRILLALTALWMGSCGEPEAADDPGILTLDDEGADRVVGSYELAGQVMGLESLRSPDGVVEVVLDLRGMSLDAVVDRASGVASLDGFTASDGTPTQMTEEDRELLMGLYRALNERWPGSDIPPAEKMLRRVVGLWAEHPVTLEMTREVFGESDRTITYLCPYIYCRDDGAPDGPCDYYVWFNYATHDDWNYERYNHCSSQRVQVGDHTRCDGDEWYWTDGEEWRCGEPDHWAYPYVMGNCFGRSGPGCGGDTQYTLDPTDHDGCVRNGHAIYSAFCNDEFAASSDDELFGDDCY